MDFHGFPDHFHPFPWLFLPSSSISRKYEEEDTEVCIKLDGDSIKPCHAILESLESTGVTIQSAHQDAVLWVNGDAVAFGAEKARKRSRGAEKKR